jgi:hypothetical protein
LERAACHWASTALTRAVVRISSSFCPDLMADCCQD